MNRTSLFVLCVALGSCVTGCMFVATFTNSKAYRLVEHSQTFTVTLDKNQTELTDRKIASLLEHQMELLGYGKSSPEIADLQVAFNHSVQAVAQEGAYSAGQGSSTTIYRKSLHVTIYDRSESVRIGRPMPVWEAETEEQGWCNRILATAPHIIVAMFSNYGSTVTHQKKRLTKDDDAARRLMELEPYDLRC